MQTANIMLSLNAGNDVPKRNVSAAEIAVLRAIHGEEAVQEVEPTGSRDTVDIDGATVKWTNRVELERLRRIYGRAKDDENNIIIDRLYPGAAARVFETLDELNIPDEFYKATQRHKPDPLDHDGDGKKGGAKGRKAKAKVEPEAASEPEAQADEPEDDIAEMPDNSADGENLFQ